MKGVLLILWHLTLCLLCTEAYQVLDLPPPPPYNPAFDNGSQGYYPTREYVTADDIRSPQTNWLQWSPRCDDGLLYFITPRGYSLPRPGPMILDRRGELIWNHHFDKENKFGGQAYDFTVQNYKGEDYLTFWLGDDRIRGHGSGFYYMLNASYDIVHKIGGGNGLFADLHEFLITPEGTALMTMYQIVPGDVTMLRDFDSTTPEDKNPNYIWDCVFQELTVETGEVIFEWRASEHFNMTETYRGIEFGGTKADPFDWFHINSVEKDELGNYLISARYTHSLTYIDGKTKETIWQLGGKNNYFMDLSDGNATNFAWQHDARFLPTDTFPTMYTPPAPRPGFTTKLVTVFDNAAEDQHYHYGPDVSRSLLLEVTYPNPGSRRPMSELSRLIGSEPGLAKRGFGADNQNKLEHINRTDPDYTVRVVKSYENPLRLLSSSQGSMQILPQGRGEDPKVFVGYGLNAVWTEFDANGTVLCDVHFGANTSFERGDIQSYRAYKFAWTGRPETRPSVDITDDDAEVYVSWNGATDVVEWVLQCSNTGRVSETDWADIARVPKLQFETTIAIPDDVADSRYLRVIALAENSRRLDYGTSLTIDRGIVASYFPSLNSKLPETVAHMSPTKVFIVIFCNISLIFVLYEAYRRYLVWRHGRPSSGPLIWRKPAPAFRVLGEA